MKAREIRQMSQNELENHLEDLQAELFNLRFQHATRQDRSPIRLRTLRREIARVYTIITENNKSIKK
ncbi:MAG: 50S ribosomal protein L29 [Candidatus Delongbacteria bacterium]|nr:50S ribosomal protein L29 [Candidatus Delongbacteria bacterium]